MLLAVLSHVQSEEGRAMNGMHEAVTGGNLLPPTERLSQEDRDLFVSLSFNAGELLDDAWAAEFDRRVAAWEAEHPSVLDAVSASASRPDAAIE